jgi:hypothetical protein
MRCGVGRKVIVCCAALNVKRVGNSKVTMGVQSRATVRSDVIPLYNVQCSQASCLRSRTFRSDFAARELLCKRTRTKLELATDCHPCRSVIAGVLGAVKLCGLYQAFRKERKVSLHPPCQINLLKPTGYMMYHQFNTQQLYALPTLYLSEKKQRLVPLTS